jgi:hypothetical protein
VRRALMDAVTPSAGTVAGGPPCGRRDARVVCRDCSLGTSSIAASAAAGLRSSNALPARDRGAALAVGHLRASIDF